MLENVRFVAAETSKDEVTRAGFAAELAELADSYVETRSARCTASTPGSTTSHGCCRTRGPLVRAEVDVLRRLTEDPARPYTVVLGGSKVRTSSRSSTGCSAGRPHPGRRRHGVHLPAAQGHEVGKSLLESDQLDAVRGYLSRAASRAST